MKAMFLSISVLSLGSLVGTLGGCAEEVRSDLPSNAVQVSSGDKVIAFTAPHDGKAYLNDDMDKRVVYSTELKRGQLMRFDPDADVVRIDGNTAPEGVANPGHQHSIFFARSAQADEVSADSNAANSQTMDNGAGGVPTVRVPIGIQVDVQTRPSPQN